MGRTDYASHGENAVVLGAIAAVQGDKIVGASIDDYQFMSTDAGVKGVPNSDKGFSKGYANPKNVLASKRVNADYYSKNMKDKAGSTISYTDNLNAIEKFAAGKTIAELEKVQGYLTAIPVILRISYIFNNKRKFIFII